LALIYISQINLTRYPYWQFGASEALIAITSPTWIPYLISALHSRRVVMSQDGGVLWFIISITLITAIVGAVLLGVFGPIWRVAVFWISGAQIFAFLWVGEFLLRKGPLQ
jgi:hypothetical protein